jgi:hypothetical protein
MILAIPDCFMSISDINMSIHKDACQAGDTMTLIFAETALLPEGWVQDVLVDVTDGRIASVVVGVQNRQMRCAWISCCPRR